MTTLSTWKDKSGKGNDFIGYSGKNKPKIIEGSLNGLDGISFLYSDDSSMKLGTSNLSAGPQTEINNCKTIFIVWKDLDNDKTTIAMNSKSGGPPPLLGSEASLGTSDGHTISDFGTSHGGTETFWATNGTHTALKAGITRINGVNEFSGIGTDASVKRSSMVGTANLASVQISTGNPNTGYGDGAGDRVGVVLSGLGNSRDHSSYITNYVIYELIVYTGNLDGLNRSTIKGGTTHGNVGSDTLFSGTPPGFIKADEYSIDSSYDFKLMEATNTFVNHTNWNNVVSNFTAAYNSGGTGWVKSIITHDSKTLFRFDNQEDLHGHMNIKWGPTGFSNSSTVGFVNVTEANKNVYNGIDYWHFDTTNFKLVRYKASKTTSDLISIEKYLQKKWNLVGAEESASDTLPNVTSTNCILSLHLDSSNPENLSPSAKLAMSEATNLGISNSVIDTIKVGIPSVPSSGKAVLSTSLLSNIKNNILGTEIEKRKKRISLFKLLFTLNTELKQMVGIKPSDLSLPSNFLKSNVNIIKPGENVNLTEYDKSTTGFYCPLVNLEAITFSLDNKSFTFSRQDDGNNERYKLEANDWTGVTISTDASTFDTNDNSNSSNYLTPDNNIKITSGTKSYSFFIGSIGDANPAPSNIILTAGNRVHVDNTRSDGVNLTSFQVDGGSYIKKDVHIGGNLNISDSASILATEAAFNTEEVVFDNPLLLIGQLNTGDNLLGGIMNRYQDTNSDYKFTGLIKHNTGTKPYVLINEVDADTTNNKDISGTNLDTVVNNSSNNFKNNYCNINIDKVKALSTNINNNEDIGIYTKGSLAITNNIYIGDTNHTNGNIQIGDNTNIQYEKNSDGKLYLKTNQDLDLKAVADGGNVKSISYTSANDLNYSSSQKYTTNITNNLVETITNDLSYNIQGESVETYKTNLHTKTNINKLTHHLPFYNNINSTLRTDITGNMEKIVDGTNHFYLTNNITETFNKNKLINQNNLVENLKDFKYLTVTKDMDNVYGNNHLNIAKTHDIIVHTNNSETYGNINQTKLGNVIKTVGKSITITTTNYIVTATGGKFLIDGVIAPSLSLKTNNIYNFDLTDSSLANHPFKLSTTSDGTHGGGSEYSINIINNILSLTVNSPITLYYYCNNHSAMGNSIIITNSATMNYNLNISTNASLYTNNNIVTYKKNLNDISEHTTTNVSLNHDLFLNKINNTEITGVSSETYKKINEITISNNLNQIISGNSNITALNTTNIYKKGIINLTEGNDSKTTNNEYDLVLHQNLSEVYGANESYTVGNNLIINYNNSLTETYNSSYTSVIDSSTTVATTTNYTVTANAGKYLINGVSQLSLQLQANNIYVFNLDDNSLNSHPFLLSTTNNGSHNAGTTYSTNVVYNIDGTNVNETDYLSQFISGSSRTLTFTPTSPITLYYYCHVHSNMGDIISVIESTNIINISNNINTLIGTGDSTNIDSLVIGNKLNILYVGDSTETYKSDLNSTSNNYNINLSKQYNMICYNSTNTYNSDYTIQYDNNLIETIANITTSYRVTGGNGSIIQMRECVVRIDETNGLSHKIPNQYVPGDVIDSITLEKGDLILFDYTPGSGNTFPVTEAAGNFNADLAALNGIYSINDL